MGFLKNKADRKIIFIGLAIELFFVSLLLIERFRAQFGDNGFLLSDARLRFFILSALAAVFCLYVFAYRILARVPQVNIKVVVVFFILFNFTLLWARPVFSIDLFSYVGLGRISSEYHANPYTVPYNNFSGDDLFYANHWLSIPALYGPIFMAISAAISFLGGGQDIAVNIILFKLFFIALNLINCRLIHKMFNNIKATFLYAWNPLILFETAGEGHNDILTIFFLLLGFYFFLKTDKTKNFIIAWAFFFCSLLIKYISLPLLPIIYLGSILSLKIKESVRYIIISLPVSLLIVFVFFFPFWAGWEIFAPYRAISRLALESALNGTMPFFPPLLLTVFMVLFRLIGWSADMVRLIAGFYAGQIWVFAAAYIFIFYGFIKKSSGRVRVAAINHAAAASLIFLFVGASWIFPWYFIAPLVLFILAAAINDYRPIYLNLAYLVTIFSLLMHIIVY